MTHNRHHPLVGMVTQVEQIGALEKRLGALAPSVAPQPLPRVLAAAGNASSGDGALGALQAPSARSGGSHSMQGQSLPG